MSTFICRECDEEISINDGLDPADYCNACVHTVVDHLQSKLTTLLEAAEAYGAFHGRHDEVMTSWELEQEYEAAHARFSAALIAAANPGRKS